MCVETRRHICYTMLTIFSEPLPRSHWTRDTVGRKGPPSGMATVRCRLVEERVGQVPRWIPSASECMS